MIKVDIIDTFYPFSKSNLYNSIDELLKHYDLEEWEINKILNGEIYSKDNYIEIIRFILTK